MARGGAGGSMVREMRDSQRCTTAIGVLRKMIPESLLHRVTYGAPKKKMCPLVESDPELSRLRRVLKIPQDTPCNTQVTALLLIKDIVSSLQK